MGDEVFTVEEKAILGEIDESSEAGGQAKPPEGGIPPEGGQTPPETKPEHTEDEQKAIEQGGAKVEVDPKGKTWIIDDEGTRIPLKRWRENYRAGKEAERTAQETQRKFNLYRELGQDKYFELYPDEKPKDYKPPARKDIQEPTIPADMGSMMVEGGPYHGKTLNQVYAINPAHAQLIQNNFIDSQRQKVNAAQQERETVLREAEGEINAFSEKLSTEMFGKKSGELSEMEVSTLRDAIQQTLDWMAANPMRHHGNIEDAWFVANRETILKTVGEKAGKAALEALKKPGVGSIDTSGGKGPVGTDALESMTSDQLQAEIERWPEAKLMKFLKDAPAALKAKHPSLPWD